MSPNKALKAGNKSKPAYKFVNKSQTQIATIKLKNSLALGSIVTLDCQNERHANGAVNKRPKTAMFVRATVVNNAIAKITTSTEENLVCIGRLKNSSATFVPNIISTS
jgi:hypothetical protein